jgi:hypothetical protein
MLLKPDSVPEIRGTNRINFKINYLITCAAQERILCVIERGLL